MPKDSLKAYGAISSAFYGFASFHLFTLGNNSSQVSHPPHLTSIWSSALIPFCANQTDLDMSKNSLALPGITFPLCSSFLPTVLEAQLCYKLTLNKTSGPGKKNELMLLLDYNEDLSLQMYADHSEEVESSKKTLNFDTAVEKIHSISAKIQIETLSHYTSYGGGIFTMTDVKRMTAKDDFLKMPLNERNCEIELYEDCRTRKLMDECSCAPWEISGYQVGTQL